MISVLALCPPLLIRGRLERNHPCFGFVTVLPRTLPVDAWLMIVTGLDVLYQAICGFRNRSGQGIVTFRPVELEPLHLKLPRRVFEIERRAGVFRRAPSAALPLEDL